MIIGQLRNWINKANENTNLPYLILGFLVLVLGISVRVNFVSGSPLPYNDGGFFYTMTDELVKNEFLLPEYTSYNHSDIPFAYPPLAFYLVGVIHYLSGISLLILFKLFPLIISCFSIPVFYVLTGKFFKEKTYRMLAVFIFATLPRSFEWFVMGGGVTRSIGFFFAMLSIYFLWGAFQENKFGSSVIWGAIFSTLTILSHPVTSLFLVFSVVVMYIYHFPVKIKLLISIAGLIIVLTSPWWASVIINHGLSPFIGATNTGQINWFEIKNLITLNYGYENPNFLAIVSVLAIIGIFSKRKKIALTLGILCVFGYVVIPRGGVDLLTIYLPLLATIGFQVVTESWDKVGESREKNIFPDELRSKRTRLFLGFLFIYLFLGAYTYKYAYNKSDLRLNQNNILAMDWVKENTDLLDSFLLIPTNADNRYWWNDYVSEWFPALTERKSITTVQGYEWKPEVFADRILLYTSLRNCSIEYACIKDWQGENGMIADYIYFDSLENQSALTVDFLNSGFFDRVYENENVLILKKSE